MPTTAPPDSPALCPPGAPSGGGATAARHARLTAEAAARLGPLCRHMERERFNGLVADVVRFTLRWSDDVRPPTD